MIRARIGRRRVFLCARGRLSQSFGGAPPMPVPPDAFNGNAGIAPAARAGRPSWLRLSAAPLNSLPGNGLAHSLGPIVRQLGARPPPGRARPGPPTDRTQHRRQVPKGTPAALRGGFCNWLIFNEFWKFCRAFVAQNQLHLIHRSLMHKSMDHKGICAEVRQYGAAFGMILSETN